MLRIVATIVSLQRANGNMNMSIATCLKVSALSFSGILSLKQMSLCQALVPQNVENFTMMKLINYAGSLAMLLFMVTVASMLFL